MLAYCLGLGKGEYVSRQLGRYFVRSVAACQVESVGAGPPEGCHFTSRVAVQAPAWAGVFAGRLIWTVNNYAFDLAVRVRSLNATLGFDVLL
jgi:hypothetical protein